MDCNSSSNGIRVNGVEESPRRLSGDSFIRPHLLKLPPLMHIFPSEVLSAQLGMKPEDIIKLDANENPYVFNIFAKCRCVLDPGDKLVVPKYQFVATVSNGIVIKVPRKADFSLDLEKIIEVVKREKPKCICLTSPNNPDGSVISDEVLLKILNLPTLVVLDEAYIEFSGMESRMTWVKKHENLIVLRTFSKSAGLAGIRVGYGAFPLSIAEYVWKVKQPYSVSVAAEVAACATLKNLDYLEKVKVALVQERERLYKLLLKVPFLEPFPSRASFVLCEVTSGIDAKKLKDDLARSGIVIRHYSSLKNFVRISVGKPEHTNALMDWLNRLY